MRKQLQCCIILYFRYHIFTVDHPLQKQTASWDFANWSAEKRKLRIRSGANDLRNQRAAAGARPRTGDAWTLVMTHVAISAAWRG